MGALVHIYFRNELGGALIGAGALNIANTVILSVPLSQKYNY